MEKRLSKRLRVKLNARCVSIDVCHATYVENVSEEGVFIQTAPADTKIDFTSGMPVELQIQLHSGETITLNCEIRWAYQNPPDGMSSSVGMKIIDPPSQYKEFLKTLV